MFKTKKLHIEGISREKGREILQDIKGVKKVINFNCDNPYCKFKMEIHESDIPNMNYCPVCGTKDGDYKPKVDLYFKDEEL